jgi:integrase/ribosomal protein L40E
MRTVVDIHNREADLNNLLEKFKKIRDINKPTMEKYYNFISANGLSIARKDKELRILINLSKWLKKDFKKANRGDIEKLVQTIESNPLLKSEWTKCDYKVIIKKFYSWLRGFERKEYPPEVRWIKTTLKNKNHKLPEELLTKEEVDRLVECAEHLRDKAFIRVLYESGCRIGEVANLRIKDVQFDDIGCFIIVTGKTGDRRIRLIESTQLLGELIDNHVFRNNPESFLWLGLGTKNKNKLLSYAGFVKILKGSMEKSEIRKKIYPHLFRHSRATELAKHLTEFQLKQMMGWTMGSDMPQVYVSLSGKDLDNAILKSYGIKTKDEEKLKFKFKICDKCKAKNDVIKKHCSKCGHLLSRPTGKLEGIIDELIELNESELEEVKQGIREKKISKEIVKMVSPELYA